MLEDVRKYQKILEDTKRCYKMLQDTRRFIKKREKSSATMIHQKNKHFFQYLKTTSFLTKN